MTTFLSWCRSPPNNRVTGSWIPFNKPEMCLPQGGLFRDTPPFCQPCQCGTRGWPPREPLCANSIQTLTSSSRRIHESDHKSEKERKGIQNNFRERKDGPLSEQEEGGEGERIWIFHHSFSEAVCSSLLIKQFGIKLGWLGLWLPWQSLAVCSRLRLL